MLKRPNWELLTKYFCKPKTPRRMAARPAVDPANLQAASPSVLAQAAELAIGPNGRADLINALRCGNGQTGRLPIPYKEGCKKGRRMAFKRYNDRHGQR
jgi:hypothetical protein